jgi:glycoside/pentoside/hexuronide:cation symporter, GPH family
MNMNVSIEHRRAHPGVGEKIGYALGDTAANFVWRAVIVFLPFFLTDAAGIGPAAVGVLLLVCRIWDGATDLAMGAVADRTRTRWGKFRPWIIWTAIPFAALGVLTFTTPDLGPTGKLVYAYVTYSALIILYTMNNVPYNALMGVMSSSPTVRGTISSYRFVFAFLGGLLLQGLTPTLIFAIGSPEAAYDRAVSGMQAGGLGGTAEGLYYHTFAAIGAFFNAPFFRSLFGEGLGFPYSASMTLFGVVAVILFAITFVTTRERVVPVVDRVSRLRDDLADLVANRPWVILFLVGILFVTFTTLKNGVIMYYFTYYVGSVELAGLFMVVGLIGAMIGAALTGILVGYIGKRRLMIGAVAIGVVSSTLLYIPGPENVLSIFVLGTITEFSTGPMVALFFAMLADTADYSEWKTNRRATGLFYSAGTVAMKFGSGIGGALTGFLLAAFGYAAAAEGVAATQSDEAVFGIRLLISVIPAAVAGLMLIAFLFYHLDDARLSEIESDLTLRRGIEGTPGVAPL